MKIHLIGCVQSFDTNCLMRYLAMIALVRFIIENGRWKDTGFLNFSEQFRNESVIWNKNFVEIVTEYLFVFPIIKFIKVGRGISKRFCFVRASVLKVDAGRTLELFQLCGPTMAVCETQHSKKGTLLKTFQSMLPTFQTLDREFMSDSKRTLKHFNPRKRPQVSAPIISQLMEMIKQELNWNLYSQRFGGIQCSIGEY